jgi:hypothetical protein
VSRVKMGKYTQTNKTLETLSQLRDYYNAIYSASDYQNSDHHYYIPPLQLKDLGNNTNSCDGGHYPVGKVNKYGGGGVIITIVEM